MIHSRGFRGESLNPSLLQACRVFLNKLDVIVEYTTMNWMMKIAATNRLIALFQMILTALLK